MRASAFASLISSNETKAGCLSCYINEFDWTHVVISVVMQSVYFYLLYSVYFTAEQKQIHVLYNKKNNSIWLFIANKQSSSFGNPVVFIRFSAYMYLLAYQHDDINNKTTLFIPFWHDLLCAAIVLSTWLYQLYVVFLLSMFPCCNYLAAEGLYPTIDFKGCLGSNVQYRSILQLFRGLLKKQLHTVLVYPAIMLKFCTTKQILQSSLNFTCLTLQQIYLVLDTYIFLYITTDITWYRHTLY